jgi:hypothetical protein
MRSMVGAMTGPHQQCLRRCVSQPVGLPDISRGSSAATPPETGASNHRHPDGVTESVRQPAGLPDISRGSSAATPPEPAPNQPHPDGVTEIERGERVGWVEPEAKPHHPQRREGMFGGIVATAPRVARGSSHPAEPSPRPPHASGAPPGCAGLNRFLPGGLRSASTPGYSLSSLRLELPAPPSRANPQGCRILAGGRAQRHARKRARQTNLTRKG